MSIISDLLVEASGLPEDVVPILTLIARQCRDAENPRSAAVRALAAAGEWAPADLLARAHRGNA